MDKKRYLADKIKQNKKIIFGFTKIYNTVCSICRVKLIKSQGKLPYNQYCHKCKEKIKPILEDIQGKIEE